MYVAMEIASCQLVSAIELGNRGSRRVGKPSSICRGVEKREIFSVQVNNLDFRVRIGEIGGCLLGRWQGRDGASRKDFSTREWVDVRTIRSRGNEQLDEEMEQMKVCVRCGMTYRDEDNSPVACKYHGHMTGDRGLYALAPPHQGIDGEWTDASGVIVYKWNSEYERPSTGSKNWKRRWTCCGVYAEDGAPCHSGRHVTYDDGATRF